MMISYGDDSLDKTKTRVFAASSVVARKEDWKDLYERWSSLNGDRPFHAADCESDRGDFASTNHESNKRLYAKNVGLIVNSKLIGAGVSISIQDYKQIFPFAPPENDWPYYMCFGGALACVARIAQLSVPPERVQVYFDQNRDRDYNTGKLYDLETILKDVEAIQ
jgi:hypothetical protein